MSSTSTPATTPTTTTTSNRSLSGSATAQPPTAEDTSDARPASSRHFTREETNEAVQHLVSLGYDPASIWEQKVVWGDHDQFGHVNNVRFVRWFESSRMFFSEQLMNQDHFTDQRRNEVLRGTGKSFILANISVRYRRPVVYPDTILIAQACALPLSTDRFMLKAAAYSLKQKTIVALSDQDCVTYDYTHLRKCDIPHDIRVALETVGSHDLASPPSSSSSTTKEKK
ncbi:Thioesterase/thiol ester dehydrase-isomerase [Testicularia cyperi]|uniref:Thioesterase/thiol ester dehydrase-isomerase n=1 Tax=Testicularia cyperi TaxID=1882483 RepID=A0A317XG72_9BASI|nr:Thioesterase/thiol ester dehydrase-isomerase [Testicularia cyperi]